MADLYEYPEIYDERFSQGAHEAYKNHYRRIFAGKNVETILDCSFGTGCLTFPLVELGYRVSGSDLSGPMLERGREKARAAGLSVSLSQCDFRELSRHFPPGFDCVMSTGSALAHVDNADVCRTLREMDALVRPGGYLYYDSRNWEAELENKPRFQWAKPFIRPDGVRINCVQVWNYHKDDSIIIHICNGYEMDGKIFQTSEFEEELIPFPISLACSVLEELGYRAPEIRPCPWQEDRPVEETGWYCLAAQKPER